MYLSRANLLALGGAMVATPNTAATLHGVDGTFPVHTKGLFYTRFVRSSGTDRRKIDSLGFVVKAIDRPGPQNVVEELNQYNKKRLVITGTKYPPTNITLYDTVDGGAMQLMAAYSDYHFGDFSQNSTSWRDDILNNEMLDNGSGFGVKIPDNGQFAGEGINSQFYIDAIEVFRLFGGYFQKYTLVNPRIVSFSPDEMDYSQQGEISTMQLSIMYEGLLWLDNGAPVPIERDPALQALFRQNGPLNGQLVSYPSALPGYNFSQSSGLEQLAVSAAGGFLDAVASGKPLGSNLRDIATGVGVGVLSRFGSLDFGGEVSSFINGSKGNLLAAATRNEGLANILNVGTSAAVTAFSGDSLLRGSSSGTGALQDGLTSLTNSVFKKSFGKNGNGIVGGLASGLVKGLVNATMTSVKSNGGSPLDLINPASKKTSVSSKVAQVFNGSSSGSIQIGKNKLTSFLPSRDDGF